MASRRHSQLQLAVGTFVHYAASLARANGDLPEDVPEIEVRVARMVASTFTEKQEELLIDLAGKLESSISKRAHQARFASLVLDVIDSVEKAKKSVPRRRNGDLWKNTQVVQLVASNLSCKSKFGEFEIPADATDALALEVVRQFSATGSNGSRQERVRKVLAKAIGGNSPSARTVASTIGSLSGVEQSQGNFKDTGSAATAFAADPRPRDIALWCLAQAFRGATHDDLLEILDAARTILMQPKKEPLQQPASSTAVSSVKDVSPSPPGRARPAKRSRREA